MYVKIGALDVNNELGTSTTYTEIRNLSFRPEVDVTCDTVPISEMQVDIKTDDAIEVGNWIQLFDDLDQSWCLYIIVFADWVDDDFYRVQAQSAVYVLDTSDKLAAKIYLENTALSTVLSEAMSGYSFDVDSSFSSATIKGYMPEQTARERLQYICFAIGAYVEESNDSATLKIAKLDTNATVTNVPKSKTYWKPTPTFNDYVTKIKVTKYVFYSGTPAAGDKYVTINDVNYIYSETSVELTNSSAPQSAHENVISVDGMYLSNTANADAIASRLALLYFARMEVSADIINNYEYLPPQKIGVQVDEEHNAVGYIKSCDFKYGLQAKSTVKMLVTELVEMGNLTIRYMHDSEVLATRHYTFPVGYEYSIENQYVDQKKTEHRYIYRPQNQYATGTIVAGANINEQEYDVALHYYVNSKLLRIGSVSDIEWDSTDKELEIN